MPWLRALHHVALIGWLGSAAVDILLELSLRRARGAERQRALIELHRLVDQCLEGPGFVLTALTGAAMLWVAGYLAPGRPWPGWLVAMVVCGGVAIAVNLSCVVFVVARARDTAAAAATDGDRAAEPLTQASVRRWQGPIYATGVGIPLALVALWFALVR